nr:12584_t:CDS:2 [Entrophospora candida]
MSDSIPPWCLFKERSNYDHDVHDEMFIRLVVLLYNKDISIEI